MPHSGLYRPSFVTACGRATFPGGEGFYPAENGKIPAPADGRFRHMDE